MTSNGPKFRCENFGQCQLADSRELLWFDEDGNFRCEKSGYTECPAKLANCREKLVAAPQESRGPAMLWIAGGLVSFALAAWLVLGSSCAPSKEAVEKAVVGDLKRIWPWLSE